MAILLETDAWLAESLGGSIGSDTLVVADLVAAERLLADDARQDLVVIGPDADLELALDFARRERVTRPAVGVVVVRRRVDTSLMKDALRAGVRGVVKLDDLMGLAEACRESREMSLQLRGDDATSPVAGDGQLGQLVTVFSAKGGCGKTTMATNLAAAMAKGGRRVCLVDLDLAFGDVAIAMQLFPTRSVADAAALGGRLDEAALRALVTPHGPNLDTLLAPVEPGAAELIGAPLVTDLLQVLKRMYDVVIVDTPPAFNDHVLATFDVTDEFVLVMTLDVPALKNLKLTLEMLELLGYARDRRRIVLNRADAKVGLSLADVERTLSTGIAAHIPSSRDVPASINRGVPLVIDSPAHAVSTAIRKFAATLAVTAVPAVPAQRGAHRRFSRRSRSGTSA